MPKRQTNKITLKTPLSFSFLAIFAGFSLHYLSASNMINTLVRSQPNDPDYTNTVHSVSYHVRKMDVIIGVVTSLHAEHLADIHFATEELATDLEVKEDSFLMPLTMAKVDD